MEELHKLIKKIFKSKADHSKLGKGETTKIFCELNNAAKAKLVKNNLKEDKLIIVLKIPIKSNKKEEKGEKSR